MTENKAKKPSVIVCDDEAHTRNILVDILKEKFPKVQVVESSYEADAFKKIQRQRFDLLINGFSNQPKPDGAKPFMSLNHLPEENRPKATVILSANPFENAMVESFKIENLKAENIKDHLKDGLYLLKKPCPTDALRATLEEAMNYSIGPTEKKTEETMDVMFISPFIESTVKILDGVCHVKCTKEKVFLKRSGQMLSDISAIVAMEDKKYRGSMAISFSKSAYLGVLSGMLGETITELSDKYVNAVAEICNQVFGMAKTRLHTLGYSLQPAIPSVVNGSNHDVQHHLTEAPIIVVQFKTDHGLFHVEACIAARAPVVSSS